MRGTGHLLAAGGLASLGAGRLGNAAEKPIKKVAAINTSYRMRSHAYHIAGRFLVGYDVNGFHHQPPFQLASMYNDQYPAGDLSRGLAAKHEFKIAETVADALGGPGKVDVDAVLLIAEHGDYPLNELGQKLYPRLRLFREIVKAFRAAGRSVPVFNDKHLSYDYRHAAEMVGVAREMGFGLMAGSSLPVTWRQPVLEPPLETPLTEALVCHAGGTEIYGFHALETLQCMLERRRGGETGVQRVTCLQGPAVWKAGNDGLWSRDLLRAALSRSPSSNYGDPRDNVDNPIAILVEYADGTRGTCLNLREHVSDFTFAAQVKGREEPISTCFYLPSPPGAKYFDALTFNIEKFFASGAPPYPVERTQLTTTVLDFAMRSLHENSKPIAHPAMKIAYQAPKDSGFFRGRITQAD
ncbi:MAG: hypothetical protein N2C14_19440 [Planctomycetales bacterium]